MQLTNSELVLAAAGAGVLGTVLGAAIGGGLAYRIARFAGQDQRILERERREHETRAQLYQDMLAEAERQARHIGQVLFEPPSEGPQFGHAPEGEWKARVTLFASPEVSRLWNAWARVLFEAHLEGFKLQSIGDNPDPAIAVAVYGARLDEAAAAMSTQMRAELEAWGIMDLYRPLRGLSY